MCIGSDSQPFGQKNEGNVKCLQTIHPPNIMSYTSPSICKTTVYIFFFTTSPEISKLNAWSF